VRLWICGVVSEAEREEDLRSVRDAVAGGDDTPAEVLTMPESRGRILTNVQAGLKAEHRLDVATPAAVLRTKFTGIEARIIGAPQMTAYAGMVVDRYCPTNTIYFINSDVIVWELRGADRPRALTVRNPRKLGVITGIS
jgi:hypothetical protein